MKFEWRKKEKEYYLPKTIPHTITIPKQTYIMVDGIGNPNEEDFKERIQTLYALSYAIRMMPKKGIDPEGYFEYTVYPLEGWWSSIQDYESIQGDGLDKSRLTYTIMVRQPEFVDQNLFDVAYKLAFKKINPDHNPRLESIPEHHCVQMMHKGSYDTESLSFEQMQTFIDDHDLSRLEQAYHQEIYIRMDKKDSSKNQTVLRYRIK